MTEAAAVGAAYIGIVGTLVLRRLSLRDIADSLVWTGLMTAVVGMLIASGSMIAWIRTLRSDGRLAAGRILGFRRGDALLSRAEVRTADVMIDCLSDGATVDCNTARRRRRCQMAAILQKLARQKMVDTMRPSYVDPEDERSAQVLEKMGYNVAPRTELERRQRPDQILRHRRDREKLQARGA